MAQLDGEGLILSAKAHGERAFVVTLLSGTHGKLQGFWRGSKKQQALLTPLTGVSYAHTRRLDNQLGNLQLEATQSQSHLWFGAALKLQVLHYLVEILSLTLPDEEPQPVLYAAVEDLIQALNTDAIWQAVVDFERVLLTELGFGIEPAAEHAVRDDAADPLTYLSPKSGRAVGAAKGAPYAEKLLPLPMCWGGPAQPEMADWQLAFQVTGTFLRQLVPLNKLPARSRLLDQLLQKAA